jgi:copper resistance protein B
MTRLVGLTATLCVFVFSTMSGAQERAEDYYDAERMRTAREALFAGTSGGVHSFVLFDRLEHQSGGADDALLWDFQAWRGGDQHKFWLKSEGDYSFDAERTEEAELQALYSRAISPNFDAQFGLRHDFGSGPSHNYLVAGLQGVAPYWFEIDTAAYLSEDGDLSFHVEAEYEVLLTQRLILQPRIELDLAASDVAELDRSSGLVASSVGVRLRYEFKREFAPYIGVEWRDLHGGSADIARLSGDDRSETVFAAGLRIWF